MGFLGDFGGIEAKIFGGNPLGV